MLEVMKFPYFGLDIEKFRDEITRKGKELINNLQVEFKINEETVMKDTSLFPHCNFVEVLGSLSIIYDQSDCKIYLESV